MDPYVWATSKSEGALEPDRMSEPVSNMVANVMDFTSTCTFGCRRV